VFCPGTRQHSMRKAMQSDQWILPQRVFFARLE
jgi:hypothetical protein